MNDKDLAARALLQPKLARLEQTRSPPSARYLPEPPGYRGEEPRHEYAEAPAVQLAYPGVAREKR